MVVRRRLEERVLRLERLEDRRVLAAVTVGNTLDVVNGDTSSIANLIASNGGDGISLREAVTAANNTAGADTIDFSTIGTITLGGTQLPITESVTITGPGQGQLTIDANNASRVFKIDDGQASDSDVAISGLTMRRGFYGGGAFTGVGGAIYTQENLTITGSMIADSRADGAGGGGIFKVGLTAKLTLIESTVSGNRATNARVGGGALYAYDGPVEIIDSTVLGNTAETGTIGGGGGITHYGLNGSLLISGSTISGNTSIASSAFSTGDGGGIYSINTVVVRNSTIVGNSALNEFGSQAFGGGIFGPAALENSIVAGNTAASGSNDISGGVIASHSLIQDAAGWFFTNDLGGNITGQDPKLGPLANNGGPTLTHLPALGPAINAGDPAAVAGVGNTPLLDQRGSGFGRVQGGRIDMGSVETSFAPETPSLTVTTALDVVNNLDGLTSLREAVLLANTQPGNDTIAFDTAGVFSTPQTITLGGTELLITDSVTITGPGQGQLTIDANNASRVFNINDGQASNSDVAISGLTMRRGFASGGSSSNGFFSGAGGAVFTRENLTITGSTIADNRSDQGSGGGGIHKMGDTSTLVLIESTVSGNRATNAEGGGGGIQVYSGKAEIINSTVSGNTSDSGIIGGGGGILLYGFAPGSSLLISGSTISGNTLTPSNSSSPSYGGGISALAGTLVVRNSTIVGNSSLAESGSLAYGGGIFGTVALENSIVTGNSAADNGSDIYGRGVAFHSLIQDTAGWSFNDLGGNITGQDPKLGPLADNGGPTLTHALLPGSPALDAGAAVPTVINGLLFNTGVDTQGSLLGDSVDDPHYTIQSQPAGGSLTDATVPADGFPIPPWLPNEPDSRWIGPSAVDAVGPAGEYVYRTTFDLSGLDFANLGFEITGRWASDNTGSDIQINGVSTGQTNLDFTAFSPFTVSTGFVAGVNTLDFVVQNTLGVPSSSGLIVDDLQLVATRDVDQRGLTAPVDLAGVPNAAGSNGIDIGAYEAQVAPSADFDSDGDVDLFDLLRQQRGFGATSGAVLADGNSDDDGDVDASDQAAWAVSFGQGAVAPVVAVSTLVSDGLENVLLAGAEETVAADLVEAAVAVEQPVDAVFSTLAPRATLVAEDSEVGDDEQEPTETVDRLFGGWDGLGGLV
ncbi:MAG: choice-of-anchor Q domain-containing protein [Planctomycetota bacterium]